MNRKKLKMSLEENNAEKYLGERITTLEKELAYKGAQLNLNNVFNEEEKEEIRKLKPEVEKLGSHLKLGKKQLLKEKGRLLMEREKIEKLLKENENLLIRTADFEERVTTAKWKLADFSNDIMKSSAAVTNINSLPDEILLKILGYITQNELVQFARVCRRWKVLSKSPVLWKRVDVEFYAWKIEAIKMFVHTLPSCVSWIEMDFTDTEYWDDEGLNFKELCVKLQEKCPHLQTLILRYVLFSDSLPLIIDLCTEFLQNVRRLVLYSSDLYKCPPREEYIGVSKIEALHVVQCCFKHINIPPSSKMPYLRVLDLHDTYATESLFEDGTSFLNGLKVLNLGSTEFDLFNKFKTTLNYAVNLKELYFCYTDLNDSDLNVINSAFLHLKTICLRSRCGVTCGGVICLIESCQSLENVYVIDDVAESCAKHPFFVVNRCKLEIVKNKKLCHYHENINYLNV